MCGPTYHNHKQTKSNQTLLSFPHFGQMCCASTVAKRNIFLVLKTRFRNCRTDLQLQKVQNNNIWSNCRAKRDGGQWLNSFARRESCKALVNFVEVVIVSHNQLNLIRERMQLPPVFTTKFFRKQFLSPLKMYPIKLLGVLLCSEETCDTNGLIKKRNNNIPLFDTPLRSKTNPCRHLLSSLWTVKVDVLLIVC